MAKMQKAQKRVVSVMATAVVVVVVVAVAAIATAKPQAKVNNPLTSKPLSRKMVKLAPAHKARPARPANRVRIVSQERIVAQESAANHAPRVSRANLVKAITARKLAPLRQQMAV